MRYMLPLAPLLIILGAALVFEVVGRWSGSGNVACAAILAAAGPGLYLSLRIDGPAQEAPRSVISAMSFDSTTRVAFDRYTRYAGPLGTTAAGPPTADTADIFVTSSFAYDRFLAISTSNHQAPVTRAKWAGYIALFALPLLEVTNGRPSYAYFNPTIRIVALDGDAARLAPIEQALRKAAPSFSFRLVNASR
jgi:hypothetical protein